MGKRCWMARLATFSHTNPLTISDIKMLQNCIFECYRPQTWTLLVWELDNEEIFDQSSGQVTTNLEVNNFVSRTSHNILRNFTLYVFYYIPQIRTNYMVNIKDPKSGTQ